MKYTKAERLEIGRRIKYNGPLVKTTYEKNIVNRVRCLIPEEAA